MIGLPRIAPGIAVAAGIGAGLWFVQHRAYQSGYAAAEAAQVAADATLYRDIIKEIENAGIDVDDPDAVLASLCRLAGDRAGPECGDL